MSDLSRGTRIASLALGAIRDAPGTAILKLAAHANVPLFRDLRC
jgi:hypothetical protein